MVKNGVNMTIKCADFMNFGQIGFWLWLNSRKLIEKSGTFTALV